jgi:hypothetical protein
MRASVGWVRMHSITHYMMIITCTQPFQHPISTAPCTCTCTCKCPLHTYIMSTSTCPLPAGRPHSIAPMLRAPDRSRSPDRLAQSSESSAPAEAAAARSSKLDAILGPVAPAKAAAARSSRLDAILGPVVPAKAAAAARSLRQTVPAWPGKLWMATRPIHELVECRKHIDKILQGRLAFADRQLASQQRAHNTMDTLCFLFAYCIEIIQTSDI